MNKFDFPSFWAGLFIGMLLLPIIVGLYRLADDYSVIAIPNCPTEDSCYADYTNGRWSIIEGERP
jgi:hypothetical protein